MSANLRLLCSVYGGPHVQLVRNACDTRNGARGGKQAFSKQGCAVATFDNRGTFNRGAAFERALWKRMGSVEVEDQVKGVDWLVQAGVTDAKRVVLHGWSYGGYMTLMCLAKAPAVFAAGVAGAPVTAWEFYDTAYTERYMSSPKANADGYAYSSVVQQAKLLAERQFIIIHGNIDENVHFENSTTLMRQVEAADTPATASMHALIELPGERHSARGVFPSVRNEIVTYLCQKLGIV